MNTKSAEQSTNRDRRSDPEVPQEQTPEPYDDATTPSTLEGRRYTIQDSPEGSIVIMVGFSRVEDRDPLPSPRKKEQTPRVKDQRPLPSSRKKKAREDGVSPTPCKPMFTCHLLDSRTQQPCGKAFPRLTDLNRHQNTALHTPEKRDFQCLLCSKKYVFESWMHRHMRVEHQSNKDPDAKENRKDGQDSHLMEVPDSEESDDLNECSVSNDVPRQTNTHGRVLDQNGAGHPNGGIPCSTTQTIARKRTFHEIIDLSEMPVDEIGRYKPRPRRDDQSALGTSTSKDVKGLEERNAPQQQSASSARSVAVPNREVQTGRVKETSVRQPAAPSDNTSGHPSHDATTTVSRFDETHGGKSSDQIIDHSLPPNQQPGDSGRFILTCKLVKIKTGRICDKVISRTTAHWADSALKKHQASSVHVREKWKAFECDQCDTKYSYPMDLKRHKSKMHGVGVRVAVFSDEESEPSGDEQE